MRVEYINITSYRGISSNAEHYYAAIATMQEDSYAAFIDGEHPYSFDTELKFFPDREQAITLCKKDNQMIYGIKAPEITEDQIWQMQYDGTIRFPSILEIVRTARKNYPHSILCFYIAGNQRAFANYLNRLQEADAGKVTEIINLLKSVKSE